MASEDAMGMDNIFDGCLGSVLHFLLAEEVERTHEGCHPFPARPACVTAKSVGSPLCTRTQIGHGYQLPFLDHGGLKQRTCRAVAGIDGDDCCLDHGNGVLNLTFPTLTRPFGLLKLAYSDIKFPLQNRTSNLHLTGLGCKFDIP